jgi:hypothetical protein
VIPVFTIVHSDFHASMHAVLLTPALVVSMRVLLSVGAASAARPKPATA